MENEMTDDAREIAHKFMTLIDCDGHAHTLECDDLTDALAAYGDQREDHGVRAAVNALAAAGWPDAARWLACSAMSSGKRLGKSEREIDRLKAEVERLRAVSGLGGSHGNGTSA